MVLDLKRTIERQERTIERQERLIRQLEERINHLEYEIRHATPETLAQLQRSLVDSTAKPEYAKLTDAKVLPK
jgi:hypothetical protein